MRKIIPVDIIVFKPAILYRCVDTETVWGKTESNHPSHMDHVLSDQPSGLAYEYRVLADWIVQTIDRFPNQIHLRVVDAISVEGIARSSRFKINSYPAAIIDHRFAFTVDHLDQAADTISRLLAEPQPEQAHWE